MYVEFLSEWLIEKINRFDTNYKIKNYYEITFPIISELYIKSRKIDRQISTSFAHFQFYNDKRSMNQRKISPDF